MANYVDTLARAAGTTPQYPLAAGGNLSRQAESSNPFAAFGAFVSRLENFLTEFEEEKPPEDDNHRYPSGGPHGKKKYLNILQRISDGEGTVLEVSIDDLTEFFGDENDDTNKHADVLTSVRSNSKRAVQLIYEAAMKVKSSKCKPSENAPPELPSARALEQSDVPVHFRAPFEVYLIPRMREKTLSIREVVAAHIGKLVKVEGVVMKVTAVKPRMVVARYKCEDCSADVFQPVEGEVFMPQARCGSQQCTNNKTGGELRLVLRECKFMKHEVVRLQESFHQVPHGSVPRSMKVIVEGELTRQLHPGMSVTIGGISLPVQKHGFEAIKGGSTSETTFYVHYASAHKKGYDEMQLTSEEMQLKLDALMKQTNLYDLLAHSIAPSIHGHEDVKKAVLLQLIGGRSEALPDGLKIRGDIHLLLMGDPGVAKSQILGKICSIAPRAHYATGKGASGVGLTASVTRDPHTGEFGLEGGAIVLADKGVCCIDEFDKMEESDRTAIHEVMEQQTVSISKAGLTTTLNARTSILAAANPVYGRYDVYKSPMQNMNLPAALLSRFDLQFLLLDRPDRERDAELARHVLTVHRHLKPPAPSSLHGEPLDAHSMRCFIARAKTYSPKILEDLVPEIVQHYIRLRSSERHDRDWDDKKSYTTPRTLFAILRMSQALARLRHSEVVERGDVEEALRLIQESKASVLNAASDREKAKGRDWRGMVIDLAKDVDNRLAARRGYNGYMPMAELEEATSRMGYSSAELMSVIEEYVELGAMQWKTDRKRAVGFLERLETANDSEISDDDDDDAL